MTRTGVETRLSSRRVRHHGGWVESVRSAAARDREAGDQAVQPRGQRRGMQADRWPSSQHRCRLTSGWLMPAGRGRMRVAIIERKNSKAP